MINIRPLPRRVPAQFRRPDRGLAAHRVYTTIQAGIGVSAWDVFHFGLAKTFGAKYGTISISVALVIVVINFMLKEQIGLGMILDALIVGKTVDFLNYVNPIPRQENLMFGVILMLAGIFIIGFSQYIYMSAALGCGLTLEDIISLDLSYAPPISPLWDPIQQAARYMQGKNLKKN